MKLTKLKLGSAGDLYFSRIQCGWPLFLKNSMELLAKPTTFQILIFDHSGFCLGFLDKVSVSVSMNHISVSKVTDLTEPLAATRDVQKSGDAQGNSMIVCPLTNSSLVLRNVRN